MLSIFFKERAYKMRIIYVEYNMYRNSIDIATYAGYILRIDCNKAEDGLRTTPGSQCALNALAIDNPLEYARLCLDGTMQMWIDAEDSLELW
jgi:hypothetical protein